MALTRTRGAALTSDTSSKKVETALESGILRKNSFVQLRSMHRTIRRTNTDTIHSKTRQFLYMIRRLRARHHLAKAKERRDEGRCRHVAAQELVEGSFPEQRGQDFGQVRLANMLASGLEKACQCPRGDRARRRARQCRKRTLHLLHSEPKCRSIHHPRRAARGSEPCRGTDGDKHAKHGWCIQRQMG